MSNQPAIDFDNPEYIWPLMPPLPPPTTPTMHPYKGADGNLYEKESDALKTHGWQNGKARWILAASFFDPPHYVFVEFIV